MPGATRALIAITLTRRGVPTSRRSRRLTPYFAPKARARALGEPGGRVDPGILERGERRVGGELGAAHREAQAVAGHRIDEAGGVAGEQQAGHAGRAGVDGERAEDRRRGDPARARGTRAEHGVRGDVPLEQPRRIREALARRRDQADVGQAGVAERRDADVVRPAHVHLPHRVEPGDALEVGADGPAARRRRMAREPEREGERGSAAVGGDRHRAPARGCAPRPPPVRHRTAPRTVGRPPLSSTSGPSHADAVLELRAGGDRRRRTSS